MHWDAFRVLVGVPVAFSHLTVQETVAQKSSKIGRRLIGSVCWSVCWSFKRVGTIGVHRYADLPMKFYRCSVGVHGMRGFANRRLTTWLRARKAMRMLRFQATMP